MSLHVKSESVPERKGGLRASIQARALRARQGLRSRLERALPQALRAEGILGKSQSVQRSRTAGKVGQRRLGRPAL